MVSDFKKKTIGRGAAYIYIETLTSLISGYIFWIIVSKISTSEVIGESSSLVSFAGIIAVIASLGIPTGIQRFIGKSFSEKKIDDARIFVMIALLMMGAGIFTCSILILTGQDLIRNNLGLRFDSGLIMISILLITSTNVTMLLRSVIISSLKTKSLPVIFISSSFAKLVVAIVLLMMGTGAMGLTFGFTFNHVVSSFLLAVLIWKTIFKTSTGDKILKDYVGNSKKILVSSMVNWIPMLIITAGSQLGTIIVFGSHGSNQAGVYFLALIIVTGITGVMNSLFTIALPTLSSLSDYRKRFAWEAIRLSTIIVVPISCSLIFYSKEIMQLLGDVYVEASTSLEILLLSVLPMCVVTGMSTLVYSYGNYRSVLIIGLAVSVPQTILYFILVPMYGGNGAAIGYTVGSVAGCLISAVMARKVGLLLFWKDLFIIFIVPTTIGYLLSAIHLNYVLGILITTVLTYIFLLKVHIITISDLRDFLDILPQFISNQIIKIIGNFKKD